MMVGGFESVLEEKYPVFAEAALKRAYSVLTYEGPGQGEPLRKFGLKYTAEWEKPNTAVLDEFLHSHANLRRSYSSAEDGRLIAREHPLHRKDRRRRGERQLRRYRRQRSIGRSEKSSRDESPDASWATRMTAGSKFEAKRERWKKGSWSDASASKARREHLEPGQPFHWLDGRGSLRQGRRRSASGGGPPQGRTRSCRTGAARRISSVPSAHCGSFSNDLDADVAADPYELAAERTSLRCAAGAEQGRDRSKNGRSAGARVAPQRTTLGHRARRSR